MRCLPPRLCGVSVECEEAVYRRTLGFRRKRRAYLEERFAAEGARPFKNRPDCHGNSCPMEHSLSVGF